MNQFKRVIVAAALVMFVAPVAYSQIVTVNILTRVFMIRHGDVAGSGFTIEVDDKQYLITARHIVSGMKDGDSIFVLHEGEWKKTPVKILLPKEQEVDEAALALPVQLSNTLPVELSTGQVTYAEESYFLGFPFGLTVGEHGINGGYPLPFVKRGIVSGFVDVAPGVTAIYLDAINNPGFSGGPVIVKGADVGRPKVIGVVSGYRNQDEPVTMKGVPSSEFSARGNSGLLVAYFISPILDAIKKNPVGFQVKK